jgi:hypothetical protein
MIHWLWKNNSSDKIVSAVYDLFLISMDKLLEDIDINKVDVKA